MPSLHHLAAMLSMAAIACARGGTAANGTGQSRQAAAGPQAAVQLVGDWHLASDPPQPPPGLRMAFTVDSASGSDYFGRLSLYFAGNTGRNADEFEPFAGTMGREGSVEFRVTHGDPSTAGILLAGRLRSDTIYVETLVVGPDSLSSRERDWFLVKR